MPPNKRGSRSRKKFRANFQTVRDPKLEILPQIDIGSQHESKIIKVRKKYTFLKGCAFAHFDRLIYAHEQLAQESQFALFASRAFWGVNRPAVLSSSSAL